MAFTGTPVVHAIGRDVVRITGATLANTANGTITQHGGAGNVTLPATFPAFAANTTRCDVNHAASPTAGTPLLDIVKSGGPPITTITITNVDPANTTGELEIWVEHIESRS